MNLLLSVLISGAVGTVVFLVLLLLRPVSGRMFSKTWHYYSLLVPIVFLLGGAVFAGWFAGAVAGWVEEYRSAQNAGMIFTEIESVEQVWFPDTIDIPVVRELIVVSFYGEHPAATPSFTVNFSPYVFAVWAAGVLVFLGFSMGKYFRFRRAVLRDAQPRDIDCKIPVVTSGAVFTPMLIGVVRPVIVLPRITLADEELSLILTHEMIHYKRKDLLYKMVGFITNAIHWYNPAVYALVRQLNTLCELSCDEKLAAEMDDGERKFYGETILQVLQQGQNIKQGNLIFVTNLFNSKKNIKRRLMNMMNAKKTKKYVAVFSLIIAVLVVAVGFAISYMGSAVQVVTEEAYEPETIVHENAVPLREREREEYLYNLRDSVQVAMNQAVVFNVTSGNHSATVTLIIPNRPSFTIVISEDQTNHIIPEGMLNAEDAAMIGAEYIKEVFGYCIDGMFVEMHFASHASNLRPYWSGRVAPTREALIVDRYLFEPMFSFLIDAETGMRVDIIYHGRNMRNILSEEEFRTFRNPITPEVSEMREAWRNTIFDILTEDEIEFYTQEARELAQRHFNNSTVVDVQLGDDWSIGPFSSPVFDENGDITSFVLGGFTFTVTDDTGRIATVVISTESGISPYRSVRTNSNDADPDFIFDDDGIGVG